MLNFYTTLKSRQIGLLLSKLINHITCYPTPLSLNLNYTAGSLAGMALVIQILSGLFLTMHYIPETDLAFDSVEHIMRDVRGGSMIRYVHANGASFFFFTVYWHMARSMYYRTYVKNAAAWHIGVVIFLLLMATAFIGYVLPWGQMSFWGATVITNLFSVVPLVGQDIVYWLWGGFGVAAPTLNRFYTLHFVLPFVVLALVILHLMALHGEGSSTPNAGNQATENGSFGAFYILKDLLGVLGFCIIFALFLLFAPNALNHPDNYIPANPMQTPAHIVPEWYFLPFYAILRTIPNKQLGAVAMAASIMILFTLPYVGLSHAVSDVVGGNVAHVVAFWGFAITTVMLGYLGAQPICTPYLELGWLFTCAYFAYPIVLRVNTETALAKLKRLRRDEQVC